MRIEGVRPNVLKIVFTHVDEQDWEKEFFVVMDLSVRDYKIVECVPSLPTLETLGRRLNQTREFYLFLGWLRSAFKDAVKSKYGETP